MLLRSWTTMGLFWLYQWLQIEEQGERVAPAGVDPVARIVRRA